MLIACDISRLLLPVFSVTYMVTQVENVVGAEREVPLHSWESFTGMPPLAVKSLEGKENGERRASNNCVIYQLKINSDLYAAYNH